MRIHDRPSRHHQSHGHHRGAVMVEAAIVLPAMFSFLAGTIMVGMGMFYYEQVTALAREGARYASVHGLQYVTETGNTAATSTTIYSNAIAPMATGLTGLTAADIVVKWSADGINWSTSTPQKQGNIVQVAVNYSWTPGKYIGVTIPMSSTSEMVIHY